VSAAGATILACAIAVFARVAMGFGIS